MLKLKQKRIKKQKGFTYVELLVVIGILGLLVAVSLSTFVTFRKSQSLALDTQLVTSALRQARNQTIASKNSSFYGVHFDNTEVVLFEGPTYVAGAGSNENFALGSNTTLAVSLSGGANNVLFDRLTGETSQNGTVVVSSSGVPQTKTVTIYKTGLVDSQ